jgi:hypothetical protein
MCHMPLSFIIPHLLLICIWSANNHTNRT